MKRLAVVALLATGLLATLAGAGGAASSKGMRYSFSGVVLASPAAGANSIGVEVRGGDRAALRRMLGQNANQAFAVDAKTEFLEWQDGAPSVVSVDELEAGDHVTVNVRAPRGAPLQRIESTPASVVSDRGDGPTRAQLPLWRFDGRLTSSAGARVSLHVTSGDWRGLHAMLGQSLEQSFAVDAKTVFIRWQGNVPTVISASALKPGDRVTVRVRAPRGSTLAQIEATPARHVGEHEPASPKEG